MKSFTRLSQVLLAVTITLAKCSSAFSFPDVSDVGVPLYSKSTTGLTLVATTGSQFTNITGQWVFPIVGTSDNVAGIQWVTQYLAMDLLPISDEALADPGVSSPPSCSNFLQVGQNVTKLYLTDDDAANDNGTVFSWAFYIWNNVTTNLTDANGDLVLFVPGETVTVTILVPELQNQGGGDAKFIYDSSVVGDIEINLQGGSLCQLSAQWGAGSPTDVQPLGFISTFTDTMATQVDVETDFSIVLGSGFGSLTILATNDDYTGGPSLIAGPFTSSETAFQILFDVDDFQY